MAAPEVKKTLGLTGVTVNAMALIAPGAFLWITFQIQAGNKGGDTDMWTGIVAALIVALLTAVSFAELARKYPEAGSGGSYYFAEKAFLDRDKAGHQRFARISKFITGWAAHLFYWVYPGVMVAFMATLVAYIFSQFGVTVSIPWQIAIAVLFSVFVGFIAVRGITGSTNISIAILILVGFESSTSLAGEAKNPKRDIPRGVLLSLVIQGLFAYLLEYFAANYAVCEKLVNVAADGTKTTGMAAAAASSAPIGDMVRLIGDAMLGGNGFALMLVIAVTVGLAVLGTTLAAINTAVRVSFAMAQDSEMPGPLGALHGKHATPHVGVWILVAVSAVIGAIGVLNTTMLTAVTLASNIGTFILYGLICFLTFVAFSGRKEFHSGKHAIVPFLGLVGNIGMLLGIVVIGLTAADPVSKNATRYALYFTLGWGLVSAFYLWWNSKKTGKDILPAMATSRGAR